MILALDVGNTNIKHGIFDGGKLRNSWRTSSDTLLTADELGITLTGFLNYAKLEAKDISGVIVSSVIPSFNYTIEHMCKLYIGKTPMFVGPGVKTGMDIRYDANQLGTDRICSAIAAHRLYSGALIVIDFGTATTFNAISEDGGFLGGAICPGVKIAAAALADNTARLPLVELVKPVSPIGKNTVQCLQSGLLYGYIGQVDYIIKKLLETMGRPAKVIATGGMAELIAQESEYDITIHSTLTLEGLRMIYEMNV